MGKGEPKIPTTFMFDVESEYGIVKLVAEPAYMRDGEWFKSGHGTTYLNPIHELADFRVSAYANRVTDAGVDADGLPDIYGLNYEYKVQSLRLAQAEDAVRVLRRLNRRMEEIQRVEGWVAQNDFAGYALRVARILGFTSFMVRNTARARAVSGSYWMPADAMTVRSWVTDRARDRGAALQR